MGLTLPTGSPLGGNRSHGGPSHAQGPAHDDPVRRIAAAPRRHRRGRRAPRLAPAPSRPAPLARAADRAGGSPAPASRGDAAGAGRRLVAPFEVVRRAPATGTSTHGLDRVGPYGLGRAAGRSATWCDAAARRRRCPTASAPWRRDVARGAVGSSGTGTNVQEAGVDEPDLAKTDGALLVRVEGDDWWYDVSGDEPRELAPHRPPRTADDDGRSCCWSATQAVVLERQRRLDGDDAERPAPARATRPG